MRTHCGSSLGFDGGYYMTCSKNFGRVLQVGCLGLIGMLTVVGCGGSETKPRPDSGTGDGGLTGTPKAQLAAATASVNVGSVDVGKTSSAVAVIVSNIGNASGTLTVTPSGVGIAATGCTGVLAAGANCTLSITATPTTAGAIMGSVTVAAAGANAVTIAVSGIATPPGNFTLDKSVIDLGNVAVGQTVPAVVTVTAVSALTGLSTGVQGADLKVDPTSTCTTSLAAGATCTVVVNFTSSTPGAAAGDYVVVSQGGVTKQVSVTANVLTLAKLVATPSTAALTAAPGGTSAPITVNVGNIGGLPSGQLTVAISGTNATDFKVTAETCSVTTLAAAATCSATVVYAPAATVTAQETATLTITDKGTGASVATVTLSGTPILPSNLTISPASADLGSVAPGASGTETVFTITNTATTASGAITAAVSVASIVISSNTCATKATLARGETCTVGVRLSPAAGVAPAAVSALLTVTPAAGNPIIAQLTGAIISGASLTANPTSVSFGSVNVNQQSAVKSVTITNGGATATKTLAVTLTGTGAAQVAITGNTCTATLAPAGTCAVSVQFSPTDTTGVNGAITVSDGSASISVPMVGTGLAPSLINFNGDGEYDFGKVVKGYASSAKTFTVKASDNATTDSGALSFAFTEANKDDFKVSENNCTVPLQPSATCTIKVVFTPGDVGKRNAVLTVTGTKGGVFPLQLTGTGLALVEIIPVDKTTDETGLDFGDQTNGIKDEHVHEYQVVVRGANDVATTSTTVTVNLATSTPPDFRNVLDEEGVVETQVNPCSGAVLGLTATTGKPITVTTQPAGAGNTWSIASSGDNNGFAVCTFWIQFTPQTGKGAKTATVTASATGSAAPVITLAGNSTGPLTINPNKYDFLSVALGSGSSTNGTNGVTLTIGNGQSGVKDFVVTNNGVLSEGKMSVKVTGTDAADFGIVVDTCTGDTLAANGDTCTVRIAFAPSSLAAKTATLTVTSASSSESATAALTGNGATAYPITVAPSGKPDAVDFGSVAQSKNGDWKIFTISNPANAALTGKLTYGAGAPFKVATLADLGGVAPAGWCGEDNTKQLDPGASCTIQVRFSPPNDSAIGTKTGTLTVAAGGTSIAVPLTGTSTSQLTVAPAAFDFGNVAQNGTALLSTILTNVGSSNLTLGVIPSNANGGPAVSVGPNSVCVNNYVLAAGATCRLDYTYTGTTPGDTIGYPTPLSVTIPTALGTVSTQVTLKAKTVNPANLALYGFDDIDNLGDGNPIKFGNVVVSGNSGTVTIYFQNTGDVDATGINATVTANSGFVIPAESGASCNTLANNILPAKQICSVRVQLTSATGGAKTGTLTLAGAGLDSVLVPLSGAAHGSNTAGVYASPVATPGSTVATIATTAVGASNSATFLLTNASGGAITFGNVALSGNTGDFEISVPTTGGCPAGANAIVAGATCQFTVTFAPDAYGDTSTDARRYRWATVDYNGNQIAAVYSQVQKPAKLQLSATGTAAITVDTGEVDFGQVVEQQSASLVFTIKNIGEGATAGGVTPTLSNSGASYASLSANTCGSGALAAGASCTVTVTVTGSVGLKNNSTLTAVGTGGETADESFQLVVRIVAAAFITVTNVGTTFGPGTPAGLADDTPVVLTIHNATGDSDVRQDSGPLSISLSNSTDFSILKGDAGPTDCWDTTVTPKAFKSLAGGETCVIWVQFNPAAGGDKSTIVSVSATPGGATQTVTLTGTGLADLMIEPAGTSAAPANLGGSAGAVTGVFTVTNIGEDTTALLRTSLGGTNASLFVIVTDTCFGQTLASGGVCTIEVDFVGTPATAAQTASIGVTDGTANNTATAYTRVVAAP